jgi:hypothetical protein
MILLGLLLMLACAALAVDAVVQNHGVVHAIAFNQPISHLSLGAVFVAGAVLGLLFALGLLMMTGGIGRAGRKRRETRQLRQRNKKLREELTERSDNSPAYPDEARTDEARTDAEQPAGKHRAG